MGGNPRSPAACEVATLSAGEKRANRIGYEFGSITRATEVGRKQEFLNRRSNGRYTQNRS
jgi:hypothetical protein